MSFSTKRGAAGALAIALLAAAGCSKPSPTPPTDFGVNMTVDASALSTSQRAMVKVGSLLVSGAESLSKQFDVSSAIQSGRLTFQFVPTAPSGVLSFEFDAIDATGVMWGSGMGGPVTLNPTGAVAVTITLVAKPGTSKAAGASCTAATECASGFCTDDVCCQESCKDTCASCALTNTRGLCTGYPDGTDPENECAGSSTTSGAGGAGGAGGKAGASGTAGAGGAGGAKKDAGAPLDASSDAEQINSPDGGIVAMPAVCGGKCNGMKACASFAKGGTSCGTPFCNTRRDVASPVCDGKGTCAIALADCTGGYACNASAKPGACRTTCSANVECLSGYYCNGTTNLCAPTKADGLTCQVDAECTNNHCASGVCCNTACNMPGTTCNNQGSAGKCQCVGVDCGGAACQIFYADSDADGYGDRNGTLSAGTAKAGCTGATPPAGFVADNTDCDDKDANVHPGQTGYFGTVSKGTGTFDYDCDQTLQKATGEYPGAGCTFCPGCSACAPGASICSSSGAQASLACPLEGGICLTMLETEQQPLLMSVMPSAVGVTSPPIIIKTACCGCNDHAGFNATVPCGQTGTYVTCGTCGAASVGVGASGGSVTTSTTKQQTCH
jgi:hypothetical protein